MSSTLQEVQKVAEPFCLAATALALLLCNYVGAAVLAWRMPHAFNQRLMVGAHIALGALAIYYTRVGLHFCIASLRFECVYPSMYR